MSFLETVDYDVEQYGDDQPFHYMNAYDFKPSQSVVATNSADPVQMANVFTAEGDQILRSVSTETASPGTTAHYAVYLLDDDATSPSDGTLAATAEETYEYGGFHQTDLAEGVLLRAGQKFSVVVTQRTASGAYQLLTESGVNEAGRDMLIEMLGMDVGTYAKGVVNRGESYFCDANGEWTDWADGIVEINAGLATTGLMDYDNFAIKAYSDPAPADFTDLDQDAWYAEAVNFVAGVDIMDGYAGTTLFRPDDAVLRHDMAAMLFKWMRLTRPRASTTRPPWRPPWTRAGSPTWKTASTTRRP